MGSLFLRNICNISHRDDWEFDAILHRNLTIEQQELHKNNKGMDDKEELRFNWKTKKRGTRKNSFLTKTTKEMMSRNNSVLT